jgi:hydroxymethylpyrimidine pyrophosphatase-like HAD family hydrolase
VTGRELLHIEEPFPELKMFDRVVAENGAVIFDPATETEQPIAPEPTGRLWSD